MPIPSKADSGAESKQAVTLPRLSLQDALVQASAQLDVAIYALNTHVNHIRVGPVKATLSPSELLEQLLADTGLTYRREQPNLYVIVAQKTPPKANPTELQAQSTAYDKPLENIIVTGTRFWQRNSDAEQARQWIGSNSYLSKSALPSTPGVSLPDIMGLLPGVSSFADMQLGQAATGESEYLSVRSMGAAYTSTFFDRVPIESADPNTRSVSLKMLSPVNIGAIRVAKTPGADWQGRTIGGAIDITTPNASSLGADSLVVTSGVNYSQLRQQRGLDNLGKQLSLEWAHQTDSSYLKGVYGALYYQQKFTAAESIEVGNYVPAVETETNLLADTSQTLQPQDFRFDFYRSDVERTGASLSANWETSHSEFTLRGQYNRYHSTGQDVQMKLTRGNTRLYDENNAFNPQGLTTNSYFQTRDTTETLSLMQFEGETQLNNKLSVKYALSAADSRIKRPDYVESSLNSGIQAGDVYFDVSNPAASSITFKAPATAEVLLNPATVKVRKFEGSNTRHSNTGWHLRTGFLYTPASGFAELEGALIYRYNNRHHSERTMTGNNGGNYAIATADGSVPVSTNPQGPNGASLPGHNIEFMDGLIPVFRVYDRAYFEQAILPVAYQDLYTATGEPNPGPYTRDDRNRNTLSGNETTYGAYLRSKGAWQALDWAIDLYAEQYDYQAEHWDMRLPTHQFTSVRASDNQWLPGISLRYQPGFDWTFRSSLRKAIARPTFSQQAAAPQLLLDSTTDKLDAVVLSNPSLEPQSALNLDLGVQWQQAAGTSAELTVYSKKIRDLIYEQENTMLINEQSVLVSKPVNGGHAEVKGIEAHVRHQVTTANHPLYGWGIDLMTTLQHSRVHIADSQNESGKAMLQAPAQSHQIQVFYESAQTMFTLAWQSTGKQLLSYSETSPDKYLQPRHSLDASFSYQFSPWTVSLQINNLLNAATFYKTLGSEQTYLGTQDAGGNGAYVETGRYATLQLTWRY